MKTAHAARRAFFPLATLAIAGALCGMTPSTRAQVAASTRAVSSMKKAAPMQRVAFRFSVRRDKFAGYKAWHKRVSPQLLRDLKAAGVSNYSIFLSSDGQAFGYFEVKNFKAYEAAMNKSQANVAWQKIMKNYISSKAPAALNPAAPLEEVFHLN